VLSARAGKDIYCEKPFCLTIGEGRALVKEMARTGRIWQCGTQRRSNPGYKFVVDLVQSGRIGKLHTITTSNGCEPGWRRNGVPRPEPEPNPDVFDYNRWLGQAPATPYCDLRVRLWRVNWATGAGSVADMGAHYMDFAQWANKTVDSAPVEFEGEGRFLPPGGINETPYFYNVRALYRNGVRLYVDAGPKGVRFDGDNGWIRLSDEGEITVDRPEVLAGLTPPGSHWKILIPHLRDFLDCVKTRRQPVSNPEVAQRSHTIIHCANLCLRLGRRLQWDPATERFTNDDEANRLLSRPMRKPWQT
jgi:predicted dehydrogenase